ncbi:MAG: hypothetical protein IJ637_06265 [Prevotella sp.]|nr:hypothetical protein [Prevotella sp.]
MKTIKTTLLLLAALLTTACGGDDGDDTPAVTISLRSQSISNGAEVDAATTTVLTLTYTQKVAIASNADITLNGKQVTAASNRVTATAIDIPLALEDGNDYVVQVAAGAVVLSSDSKVQAPAVTVSFKTSSKQPIVNPNIVPTPMTTTGDAAKKLYTYLYEQYGRKTISGVMADVNWNNALAEKVKAVTGKYPAINCYDFIHIYVPDGNGWIDYSDISPVTTWAKAGGIVELMWHFNVPTSETTEIQRSGSGVTVRPSETTFKASRALVSGTWENRFFYEQLDRVAAVILQLQEAGIAAIWRPFHEAAGNMTMKNGRGSAWFWWGADGDETFRSLWTAMFYYFQQKGINNLLWTWTAQSYNGNSAAYDEDYGWYPGPGYVDIIARDLYGSNADKNAEEFGLLQARYPDKMVILGECGHSGDNQPGLISDCWSRQARWGSFMVWYEHNYNNTGTMASAAWWQDAMSSANVITRDQLPSLR